MAVMSEGLRRRATALCHGLPVRSFLYSLGFAALTGLAGVPLRGNGSRSLNFFQ